MAQNFDRFREAQALLLQKTEQTFTRFLYDRIDFTSRLIGIVGPRGVGKTTLILQHLKKTGRQDALYVLADLALLREGDLLNLAREFYLEQGGRLLCIDEIHRFPNWNQELKNIVDLFPDLHVIFSGSSSLDLIRGKYDLSRRGLLYMLPGLSLREYINYTHKTTLPVMSLEQVLSQESRSAWQDFPFDRILQYFGKYQRHGYLPFYAAGGEESNYYQQLIAIMDKTIYEDIASVFSVKTDNLIVFKKIMEFLRSTQPGEVNIHKISQNLQRNYDTVANYLDILHQTQLIRMLPSDRTGYASIRKAKKVFLDNTNLLCALNYFGGQQESRGTMRETFLLSQLQNSGLIPLWHEPGDLIVQGNVIEVGGKNKSIKQIKHLKSSYVAADDILVGDGQTVPLYWFGMLY